MLFTSIIDSKNFTRNVINGFVKSMELCGNDFPFIRSLIPLYHQHQKLLGIQIIIYLKKSLYGYQSIHVSLFQ